MKILIVHAHHEPQSFSSALFQQSVKTLESAGHQVMTSDLYAMKFDPVSDRRNFTSVKDAGYLKQHVELVDTIFASKSPPCLIMMCIYIYIYI